MPSFLTYRGKNCWIVTIDAIMVGMVRNGKNVCQQNATLT